VESVKDYAIFALDPNGYILSWNPGAKRIKGYTAEDAIGKHFSVFYTADRVAEGFPQYELREAARVGRFEDEGWRVRKDGSRFWASVVLTALHDASGKLVGFAKVTRDLTERRTAEERAMADARRVAAEEAARQAAELARERSERLQRLTAALSAANTIPDIASTIFRDGFPAMAVNAGELAVLGEGNDHLDLWAMDESAAVREATFSLDENIPASVTVRTEQPAVLRSRATRDARFPHLAGVLAGFQTLVALPLTGRGRTIGAVVMHQRQESLSDDDFVFMESFARQVAQAVERATLYEAEQSARARADEANLAKSEFLAAMSHELRTPLNAIGGYAELLDMGLRGPVTQEQRDDLERIRRSQQHLLGIINDILNYSRIEAGQATYAREMVPIAEVFDAVRSMIAPQAAAKGLEFNVQECAIGVAALADHARVDQILLNLLSNAVKFTQQGVVGLRCDAADPRQVHITVRDSGVGIPADQLGKIFEPFVQVGRSLTSSREGTGLGLAISRDLARAMGGEITVTSTVGEGSAFTLTLSRPQ
jgi:PAS domain S-box-containing protein